MATDDDLRVLLASARALGPEYDDVLLDQWHAAHPDPAYPWDHPFWETLTPRQQMRWIRLYRRRKHPLFSMAFAMIAIWSVIPLILAVATVYHLDALAAVLAWNTLALVIWAGPFRSSSPTR